MKFLRIYTDELGDSRFQKVSEQFSDQIYAPPAPAFGVSPALASERFVRVRFPANWVSPLHAAPRRQLFVMLAGVFEWTSSTGEAELFRPGDMLLMEDTTGKGHGARVIGNEDVHGMMVHLAER